MDLTTLFNNYVSAGTNVLSASAAVQTAQVAYETACENLETALQSGTAQQQFAAGQALLSAARDLNNAENLYMQSIDAFVQAQTLLLEAVVQALGGSPTGARMKAFAKAAAMNAQATAKSIFAKNGSLKARGAALLAKLSKKKRSNR